MIDSMTCLNGLRNSLPGRRRSPCRVGRTRTMPASASSCLKELPVVVPVRQDHLPGPDPGGRGVQDPEQDLAFIGLRAGQREAHRQPGQRAEQVQAQAPEPARMRGAVPGFGEPRQLGAVRRFAGAPAFDRGRIGDPDAIGPQAGVPAQVGDHGLQGSAQVPQALVVAGLAGQVREPFDQVNPGMAQPAAFGGEAQQGLHHRTR